MKLATLREGGRDGTLAVVRRDLAVAKPVPEIAPTLQAALDDWARCAPALAEIYRRLNERHIADTIAFDPVRAASPLPRAYQWADGSAYLHHAELLRKSRKAEMPQSLYHDPLMYQGGSDSFIGPRDDIALAAEAWGIDFEAEVAVITGDVRMSASPDEALKAVRLVTLVNDVSLRNLIPAELAKGFGFFQSKPATAFAPVAVTPDELGDEWRDGRVHRPMIVHWNGKKVGQPDCGTDMVFHFGQLIAHAAKTRNLRAGSIVGSGTISNKDPKRGYCCIAEKRCLETIEHGAPQTEFMKFGDSVKIEMFDEEGRSIFGAIDQAVVQPEH